VFYEFGGDDLKDILRDMKNLGYRELQSQNIETSGGLLQWEVIVESFHN